MIVICVSNKGRHSRIPLTIGEMYNVIEKMNMPFSPSRPDDSSGPFYKVKCDDGEEKWIDEYRFRDLTLEEKREQKLNDLGI
jgi:hypothetical protein